MYIPLHLLHVKTLVSLLVCKEECSSNCSVLKNTENRIYLVIDYEFNSCSESELHYWRTYPDPHEAALTIERCDKAHMPQSISSLMRVPLHYGTCHQVNLNNIWNMNFFDIASYIIMNLQCYIVLILIMRHLFLL